MFTTLKTAVIAGLVGLTALAAVPAQADSVYLGFGDRSDAFGVYLGDSGRTYYRRRPLGSTTSIATTTATNVAAASVAARPNARSTRPSGSACAVPASPTCRAATISVVGRSHGDRVYVTFARAPSCPVIG